MLIGGLQKFSLLDYPGHLSAIIFTQGCNFKCHFCYNPMLVLPVRAGKLNNFTPPLARGGARKGHPRLSEDDLFNFFKKRANKLDGAVITGGEPTLHADLPKFLAKIKKLGYKIKLDTNGTNPPMLRNLIRKKLVDYLAMDIKGPEDRYRKIAGTKVNLAKIKKSIKIVMGGGLPYEFRTTVVPGLLEKEDIRGIGELIKGARLWYLQSFKSGIDLVDRTYRNKPSYSAKKMQKMAELGSEYVKECKVR